MKKIIGLVFVSACVLLPAATSAATFESLMDEARFSLFRLAASAAQFDPAKPTCAAMVSASVVRVGEPFILAWGAWGSDTSTAAKNEWAPTGAAIVALDTLGIHRYSFAFRSENGKEARCETRVTVI